MTDIINLNSIRSDNCGCNKPKHQSCGCNNHNNNSQPCYQAVNLGDQYFKVKNLFGELKSEWQRTEARSNLGIVDILGLEQTKESQESGGTNEWTMYTSKGGLKNDYKFYVYNGQKGDSASVEVIKTNTVDSDKDASVENVSGSDQHVKLVFDIPRGKTGETGEKGEKGDRGKSAYELAVENGFFGDLEAWLNSLKGEPGSDGGTFKIKDIKITSVDNRELPLLDDTFSGKVALWRITLANGEYFEFWVPLTTSGGNEQSESHYRYNVFLFKTVKFDTVPTTTDLDRTLSNLRNEVTGKTESQLSLAGWNSYSEAISEDGTQYIFMASCVVTDLLYGSWSVVRLTPMPGEKGEQGAKGDKGDPGTSSQGLIGPTIRIRGEYNPDTEYVNETYKPYSSNTEVHFIDIVFYKNSEDHGNWYSVVPGSPTGGGVTTKGNLPTNTNYWTKATSFDFAFINTLIAEHISSLTIDTQEIRIHDTRDNNDTIVAGMTSGNNVTYGNLTEALNYDNNGADSPVRIWAGTNFNTKGTDPNFNIAEAPFRVHQNGHLHASSAEIKGTVQANTLRLGELKNGNGTFKQADNDSTITLPNLPGNLTQMFYLLTNNGYAPDIKPNTNDNIQTPSGTLITSSNTYQTSKNKLYQCFGINHTWYIVEQDVWAASSIIDEQSSAGIKQITLIPTDQWTHPQSGENTQDQWLLQTQNIQGSLLVELFNNTDDQQVINVPDIDITIRYSAAQINQDLSIQAPNIQNIYAVEYKVRISLGQFTVNANPGLISDSYTMNQNGNYTQIISVGYNGTDRNPQPNKPDIGNAVITPNTIQYTFGSTNSYTTINLTNIPIN